MNEAVNILDVVALTRDLPQHRLVRGQVGTVVERLDARHYEVEFSDDEGRAYAMAAVPADAMLILRYAPTEAA